MLKITFLIHGKYVHGQKLIRDISVLFGSNYDFNYSVTSCAGQFTDLVCGAIAGRSTHIICAGGDGSLNETINGLMKAKNDANLKHINWQNIRVGLLPAGTGNDFARTTGIKHDLSMLKQLIDADSYKAVDLGLAELTGFGGEKARRYFINIMDIGIGGYISKKIAGSPKPFGPFITYQMAILNALLCYKNQRVTIEADTFKHQGLIMSFIMANGKYFGGGMGISPDAVPADGKFSTVIIGNISMLDYLRNMARVRKCLKIEHPELKYMDASTISIQSPDPLPVDMDGEFVGCTPLKLSMVAGAVNFICPR